MESAVDRHVFYISDGTAITAEVLGHAVMSQFPVAISSVTLPFVENISRARAVKEQIDAIYQQTGIRPLVFYSIVIPEIRDIILQSEGFCQDNPAVDREIFFTGIKSQKDCLDVQQWLVTAGALV